MSYKKFKHNLVQPIKLTQTNIDGKRYYLLPNGEKYKSVTTILGEKLDKSALHKWRKRVGEQEAQKIANMAAIKGTAVHGICERYVLNEENIYKDVKSLYIDAFQPLKAVLDRHVNNIYGIELPLYSKLLQAAGKTDLVCQFNGINSIVDFKTSKRLKKEEWIEGYFLQSTIYSMMFEWHYKVEIPQIVIIITVEDETQPQIFIKDRGQFVDRVLEVFCDK